MLDQSFPSATGRPVQDFMVSLLLRIVAVVLAASTMLSSSGMRSPQKQGDWDNLNQVTRRATYILSDRNHNCVVGKIKSIDDAVVTINRPNAMDVRIDRPNVLRVTQSSWAFHVVFSGRSSWSDVVALIPTDSRRKWHPRIIVKTNSGAEYRGELLEASDTRVSLATAERTQHLSKNEILTVTYLRHKPLSNSAEYANDELAFMKIFDPELWPALFHRQGNLAIRIYDVSSPEDDSPVGCNNDARFQTLTRH